MTSELEVQGKNLTVHPCTEQMDNFLSEFHKHFQDSAVLEPVAAFMWCLFQEDAEVVAHITNGKKNLFTWTLLEWKMRVWHHKPSFSWSPELIDSSGSHSLSRKWNVLPPLTALFVCTYLCESANFPTWKSLSPSTVPRWLMIILTLSTATVNSYYLDYASLADSNQWKSSE